MSKKILMIDDDADILETTKARLSKENFEFTGVTKGFEAVNIMVKNPPDVIIIDLMMPYIEGDTIISTFKSQNILKNISVIVCSSKPEEELKSISQKIGAIGYISKPIDYNKLIAMIK